MSRETKCTEARDGSDNEGGQTAKTHCSHKLDQPVNTDCRIISSIESNKSRRRFPFLFGTEETHARTADFQMAETCQPLVKYRYINLTAPISTGTWYSCLSPIGLERASEACVDIEIYRRARVR